MVRLGSASKAVQDAVIASVHKDVEALVLTYMGTGVASMFKNQALAKLHDADGRATVLKIVTNALAAEEKARAAEASTDETYTAPSNKA